MTKSERKQIIKWANTLTDDELEEEYSINRIDFLEWQEKGREIINEFFLA